jgi:nucleoid-associated protein YgaU
MALWQKPAVRAGGSDKVGAGLFWGRRSGVVKRAHWVLLAPTVALGALGNAALAQDAKPDDPVRRQAEELAEEASKKFGEVLKEQTPEAKPKAAARPPSTAARERSLPLLLYWLDYSEHEYRGILRRLALEGADKGWDPGTIGWLKRSSQEFQDIMQRLARAGGPASKWDPVAEAHRRVGRDKGRSEDGSARPATAPGTPSTTAPGVTLEPGTALVTPAPATGQAETAAGDPPGTGKAMGLPAGDGRAVEAPHKSDPVASATAAAEPARPEPGPQPEATRTPLASDPALGLRQSQDFPTSQVGEQPAGGTGSVAPRPHEEEEAPARPGTVTAAAKAGEEEGPGPAAPAAKTAAADKKPAEQTSDQDRLATDPASGRPGTATAEKPAPAAASSPALAERHASKIAKPGQLKGQAARHATQAQAERCSAAGAKVALPGWYVVKTGDTLWAIAERHYGAGARYRTIFLANRERLKRGPDLILPCQQLYLPPRRRRGS